MDAKFFLERRTAFIRTFYDSAVAPFSEIKNQVENELPPFDNPPYSEDGEPPFLEEWLNADAAAKVLGLTCISLLSDSLKLYFTTLQNHVFRFALKEPKTAHKNGFVSANLAALGEVLQTDWKDCPAALDVIEQIVLVRNLAQHGEHLASMEVRHNVRALEKHPNPFFADERDTKIFSGDGERPSFFLGPAVEVSRDKLLAALLEVERLAEYIDGRMDRALAWRRGSQR